MSENKITKQPILQQSDYDNYQQQNNINNNKKYQSHQKSSYLNNFINPQSNQIRISQPQNHQKEERNVDEILNENQMLKKQIDILAHLVSQQSKHTIITTSEMGQNSAHLGELDSNTLTRFQSLDQTQFRFKNGNVAVPLVQNRNSRVQKIQNAYSCELYKKKKSSQQVQRVVCKERFENQSMGMDEIEINSQDDLLFSSLNDKVEYKQTLHKNDITLINTINVQKVKSQEDDSQIRLTNHHRKINSEYNTQNMNFNLRNQRGIRKDEEKIKTQIVQDYQISNQNKAFSSDIEQRVLLDISLNQSMKIENPELQPTTFHKTSTRLQSRNQIIDMNGTSMSSLNDSEISADDATYISNYHNKNMGIITEYANPLNMHDASPFTKFLQPMDAYQEGNQMLIRKQMQYPIPIHDQTQNMTHSYLSMTQDYISNNNISYVQDGNKMIDLNDQSNLSYYQINDDSRISIKQKQVNKQQQQLQMNQDQEINDIENQFDQDIERINGYYSLQEKSYFQGEVDQYQMNEELSKIYDDELWNNNPNQENLKRSHYDSIIENQKSILVINDAQTLNQTQNQQDTEKQGYENTQIESSKLLLDQRGHPYQDLTQILSDDTSRQSQSRQNPQIRQEDRNNFQAALKEVICEYQNQPQYSINLESKSSLEDTQEIEQSTRGPSVKKPFQILDLADKRSGYIYSENERNNIYRYTPDKQSFASRQQDLNLFLDSKKSITAKKQFKEPIFQEKYTQRISMPNIDQESGTLRWHLNEEKARNIVLLNQQVIGQSLGTGQSVEALQRLCLIENDIIPKQRVTNTKQVTGKFSFQQDDVLEPSARSSRIVQDLSNIEDHRVSPREFIQAEIMDTFNPQYHAENEQDEIQLLSSARQETYEYDLIKPQPIIIIEQQFESDPINEEQQITIEDCNNFFSAKSLGPLRNESSLNNSLILSDSKRNNLSNSNGKSRFTKLAESIKKQRTEQDAQVTEYSRTQPILIQTDGEFQTSCNFEEKFETRLQQFENEKNLRININLIQQEDQKFQDKESLATPSPRVFDCSKMISQSIDVYQSVKPEVDVNQYKKEMLDSPSPIKQEYQAQDYYENQSPLREEPIISEYDSNQQSNEKFYDTSKIISNCKDSPFKHKSTITNDNILIKCETDGMSMRSSVERIISIKNAQRISVPYQYYDVEEMKYQDYSDVRIQTYESSQVNSENEQSEEEKQFNSWVQESKVHTGIKVYNSMAKNNYRDTNCISEQPSEEDLESTYNGNCKQTRDYEYIEDKVRIETSQSNEISLNNIEMLDSQMFTQGLKQFNNKNTNTNLESTKKTDSMDQPEEQHLEVSPVRQYNMSPQDLPISADNSIIDINVSKDEQDQQQMKEILKKQEFINQKIQNYKLSLQSIIDNGLQVLSQNSLLSPKSTVRNFNPDPQDQAYSSNSSQIIESNKKVIEKDSNQKVTNSQKRIDQAKERRQQIDQAKQQQLLEKLSKKSSRLQNSREYSFVGDDETQMLKALKKARNTSSKICINSKKYIESQDYKSCNDLMSTNNDMKASTISQSSECYQSFQNTKDSDCQAQNISNHHHTLKHDPIKKSSTVQNSAAKQKGTNDDCASTSRLLQQQQNKQQQHLQISHRNHQSELKQSSSSGSLTRLQALSSARDIIKGVCQQIQIDKQQQQHLEQIDSVYFNKSTNQSNKVNTSQTARSASSASAANLKMRQKPIKNQQSHQVRQKQNINDKHQLNKLSFAAQPPQTQRQDAYQQQNFMMISPFISQDSQKYKHSSESYQSSNSKQHNRQSSFRIQLIQTDIIGETPNSKISNNNSSFLSNGNLKNSVMSTPKFEKLTENNQGFDYDFQRQTVYNPEQNYDNSQSSTTHITSNQAEFFHRITEDQKKRFQLKARIIN
ncbi:UNKNOWN [Stylonychia lemnae]|uniref:Uncharacterized protein n=1 Tax=Stylonychia lemnae TaxID=5949 RepID=A0A077ZPR4_STYLE|nr:UNKNOWN [Stylonychia lemnae]|eukprot:CDW71888.1 UNKNOWN [Stylonychia lemnae]